MNNLRDALNKQASQLSSLKQLLETELHLISSREPETLTALLHEKEEALAEIEKTDAIIDPMYVQAKADDKITDDIIEATNACKAVIEECKYLTQINAKSVEQGQLRLTHLRNLMMDLRARETMTYDKSGRTKGDATNGGYSA